MQRRLPILVLILLGLVAGGAYFKFLRREQPKPVEKQTTTATPTPVDEHAAFAIFTNGLKRDFKDKKYHERNQDIYIAGDNPEIVHKHKTEITWGNFFDSLPKPMRVTKDCLTTGTGQEFCNTERAKLKFFLNGKFVDNALEMEIKDGDKLLASFGIENETEVRKQFLQLEDPQGEE